MYENGAVSLPSFFRFVAIGCVFLCINAALLYPDSSILHAKAKLESKQTLIDKPFKKLKHSCFKEELQKYKLCFSQIINARRDASAKTGKNSSQTDHNLKTDSPVEKMDCSSSKTTGNNLARTRQYFAKDNQNSAKQLSHLLSPLISNAQKDFDLHTSEVQTDETFCEIPKRQAFVGGFDETSSTGSKLTRTKTDLDLSQGQNSGTFSVSTVFNSSGSSKDNQQLCQLESGQCRKETEESQFKEPEQKPCGVKETMGDRYVSDLVILISKNGPFPL